MEKTLVLVKPDALWRGISTKVLSSIEETGFRFAGMKLIDVTEEQARKHYSEHEGREYYDRLIRFILSGPVIALVVEGPDCIKRMRAMAGKTIAAERGPGSLRGNLSVNNLYNLIHCSDCPESAGREIGIFFDDKEILEYDTASQKYWVF